MNKRATDKIISVYWFAILIIVAGGIFAIASNYYGYPPDVREAEADILADKIADCLSGQGFFREEIFDDGNFLINSTNVLGKCKLNFDVEDKWQVPQYYIEIDFFGEEDLENSFFEISQGNKNWEGDCELNSEGYKKIPVCVEKNFFTLDKNENLYLIKILSVVGKIEKNVK